MHGRGLIIIFVDNQWKHSKAEHSVYWLHHVVPIVNNILLVCKTRWLSIKSQGMKNKFMLFGIGTEVLLVLFLCYCKPLNVGLGTRNLRLVHFFPAIPFAILILIMDEGRKSLMRLISFRGKCRSYYWSDCSQKRMD